MKAEELIKDKSGRVVGVKATMNSAEYTFNAKGAAWCWLRAALARTRDGEEVQPED